MHKVLLAIVFALTLSCAVAAEYTVHADGWAKSPVSICEDTDYDITNTSHINLNSMTASDLNISTYNEPVEPEDKNISNWSWSVFTKSIDIKSLNVTPNFTTHSFKAPHNSFLLFGYAIAFTSDKDASNISQLYAYQTKLSTGTQLPKIPLTFNDNSTFTPALNGMSSDLKTLFVFIHATEFTVNYTYLTLGSDSVGKIHTLTNNTTHGIDATPGEALSSSKVYASWREGDSMKVATIDFDSGKMKDMTNLGNYSNTSRCYSYVTHSKYGVWCKHIENGNTTVSVSANSTDLYSMFTFGNASTLSITGAFVYGEYLGFFYKNTVDKNTTVLSYEIWDVATFKIHKNMTNYLTYNPHTTGQTQYSIPSGPTYFMIYEYVNSSNTLKSKLQLGLLLDPPTGSNTWLYILIGLLSIVIGTLLFLFIYRRFFAKKPLANDPSIYVNLTPNDGNH